MLFRTQLHRINATLGGGLPPGLAEIYGEASGGKTSLAASFIAQHPSLLIQTDGYPDKSLYAAFGANPCVEITRNGEAGFELACRALRAGVRVIVVDSLPGLLPSNSAADVQGRDGLEQRRLVTHALAELSALASAQKALVLLVNQMRFSRSGRVNSFMHDSVGWRIDHRIRCSRKNVITRWNSAYTVVLTVNIEFVRRRVVDETADFNMWAKKGPNEAYELLRALHDAGVLSKSGSYFFDPETGAKYGSGYARATKKLAEYAEYYEGRLLKACGAAVQEDSSED